MSTRKAKTCFFPKHDAHNKGDKERVGVEELQVVAHGSREVVLVGVDLVLLSAYRTIHPTCTAAEIAAFLFNAHGIREPNTAILGWIPYVEILFTHQRKKQTRKQTEI